MRTDVLTKRIPIYTTYFDEQGMLTDAVQTGEREVTVTELCADEGNQFVRLSDGQIVGERITLGTGDCAENYTEI